MKMRIPRFNLHCVSLCIALVTLALSSFAFCGEIHDAAAKGDLAKVKALLKANPELANDKVCGGKTSLHLVLSAGI